MKHTVSFIHFKWKIKRTLFNLCIVHQDLTHAVQPITWWLQTLGGSMILGLTMLLFFIATLCQVIPMRVHHKFYFSHGLEAASGEAQESWNLCLKKHFDFLCSSYKKWNKKWWWWREDFHITTALYTNRLLHTWSSMVGK